MNYLVEHFLLKPVLKPSLLYIDSVYTINTLHQLWFDCVGFIFYFSSTNCMSAGDVEQTVLLVNGSGIVSITGNWGAIPKPPVPEMKNINPRYFRSEVCLSPSLTYL